MKSRKYPTFEEAKEHLATLGTLEFFGRAGLQYEFCVYTITLHDGRKYGIDIYNDGNVVLSRTH